MQVFLNFSTLQFPSLENRHGTSPSLKSFLWGLNTLIQEVPVTRAKPGTGHEPYNWSEVMVIMVVVVMVMAIIAVVMVIEGMVVVMVVVVMVMAVMMMEE